MVRFGRVNVSGASSFVGVQIPQPDIDPYGTVRCCEVC